MTTCVRVPHHDGDGLLYVFDYKPQIKPSFYKNKKSFKYMVPQFSYPHENISSNMCPHVVRVT